MDIVNDNRINCFYDWVKELTNNYKVIIVLGNHDINKSKKLKFYDVRDELYDKYISNLKECNVFLINDNVYEDRFVRFVGFNLPVGAYYSSKNLEIEKNYYSSLDMSLFISKKNKVNIAVIHSPINMFDEDIRNILNNFDIILTGHMHNGLVFSFIDRLFSDNRGLVSPSKKLFPKYSRNLVKLDLNKYLIISGGITKLSKSSGMIRLFNFFYPMEIDEINIKKKIKK